MTSLTTYLVSFFSPGALAAILILLPVRVAAELNERQACNEADADVATMMAFAAEQRFKMVKPVYTSDRLNLTGKPSSGGDGPRDPPAVNQESSLSGERDELECPICLEEYEVGHKIVKLPCSRKFHGECLMQHHRNCLT